MGILPLTLFVASQTNITNSEVSIDGGGTTSRNFVFDKITKLKNFVFLLAVLQVQGERGVRRFLLVGAPAVDRRPSQKVHDKKTY